ncbi:hypothetical protein ZIOFF_066332 [Zingiber officinale]|uniref:BAG domain-containing protein n=1 Tax=Zingiber officinale TaxID=94328 RepID=A0A8J5EZL1_ZINOF|nr:hypothetical protein ZIOFF_066332 [Zingiber officinale]
MVTHPYYPADQTPHGHSSSGKAHCCECPNHSCNRRDGSVKIEEQKSENDMDNESSSLIHIPNCPPYPVLWIPPGYSKDKGTNKGFESYLPVRNGWIPMDQGGDGQNSLQTERRNQFPWPIVWMPSDQDAINHIGMKLDGDEQKSLQVNGQKNQLPWPIVWMPRNKKLDAEKDVQEITSNPKPEEKQSSKFKIIPLKFLEDENLGEKLGDSHDKDKTLSHPETVAEKETRTKIIPVRHAEEINDKKLNTEGKLRDKEEKLLNASEGKDNVAKKASDLKQSSHAKISKLPPVCLRVDPLPKKKPNGTSRSLSTPSHNDGGKVYEDKIEKQHLTKRDPDKMPTNQIEVPYVNDKFIVKVEACKEKSQDMQSTSSKDEASMVVGNQLPDKGTRLDTEEVKTEVLKHEKEYSKEAIEKTLCDSDKRHVDNTERITGKQEKKRKILSLSEAATLIQSAYRGFEVRRWQPLEKLRRIVQIRQKAEVVKNQIQEFEASSEDQDSKQKAILCETIMNLLLQLDTIQGLHQSSRDMRKSLARELVDLQEKLDFLGPTATTEHGKMTGCCSTSDMGTGAESISSDISSGRINLEPKPVSSNLDEVTNSSEFTYLDDKASIVPQHSGVVVLPSESLFSAISLDNLDPLNVERNLNPPTKTQIDLPNGQLYCPGVSHSVEKDQVTQEVIKPSASASPEDFVISFTTENEDKLEKGIVDEAIDTSEEQVGVGIEFSHPMLGNDAKDGLILQLRY